MLLSCLAQPCLGASTGPTPENIAYVERKINDELRPGMDTMLVYQAIETELNALMDTFNAKYNRKGLYCGVQVEYDVAYSTMTCQFRSGGKVYRCHEGSCQMYIMTNFSSFSTRKNKKGPIHQTNMPTPEETQPLLTFPIWRRWSFPIWRKFRNLCAHHEMYKSFELFVRKKLLILFTLVTVYAVFRFWPFLVFRRV